MQVKMKNSYLQVILMIFLIKGKYIRCIKGLLCVIDRQDEDFSLMKSSPHHTLHNDNKHPQKYPEYFDRKAAMKYDTKENKEPNDTVENGIIEHKQKRIELLIDRMHTLIGKNQRDCL